MKVIDVMVDHKELHVFWLNRKIEHKKEKCKFINLPGNKNGVSIVNNLLLVMAYTFSKSSTG